MGTHAADDERRASRTTLAWQRTRRAQAGLFATAVIAFAGSMLLARSHAAGHVKHPVRKLAAPHSFVDALRSRSLQGGVIAPVEAPPQATTSPS
jgi:hypothetical protein